MANEKIKQIKLGNTNYDIEPYLTQELTITSNNPSLNWGQTSTIGTIGETEFKVTMPERSGSTTDKYHTSGSWSGLTYTATSNGGAGTLSFTIPTGTSSTTVAKGNHTHNYLPLSGGGTISDSSTDQTTKIGAQEVTISSSMLAVSTGLTYNAIKHTINGSTYNFSFPEKGGRIALTSDLGTISGLIRQGSPSSDSTITSMNRLAADLFVSGNGSAPNNPKVAGFYLGKSETDENRHMDIVSGSDFSYIDFNKASSVKDYQARCLVNVSTGNISWQWDSGATDKTFNVAGTIRQNGTNVSLEGHTHSYAPTSASRTAGTSQKTGAILYLVGALSKDASTSTTYINPGVYINTSNQVEASGFYATSDKRLKTNIEDYTCSKSILDLPIKKFEFINKPGQVNIGCIAQDLQEICPEIVNTNEDGYLSINEGKIVYLLLEEVKKLRQELNELKRG